MAARLTQISAIFPDKHDAGLNLAAACSYQEGWTLTALLRGPAAINLLAIAVGGTYTFSANAADTAAWPPGLYVYSVRASKGVDTLEVASGQMTVKPDMAALDAPFDARSDAQRGLDAVTAVIEQRATIDQERYRINNRELWRTPIADLLKLKAIYTATVRREKARQQGGSMFGRLVPIFFR